MKSSKASIFAGHWGMALKAGDPISTGTFYEMDESESLLTLEKHSVRSRLSWLLGEDPIEKRESFQLFSETILFRPQVVGVVIPIPINRSENPEFQFELKTWIKNLCLLKKESTVFFDLGKHGHLALEPELWKHCVYDPFWHQKKPFSRYWKIHGWHKERWVRCYSEEQLRHLAELARKAHPDFVILAHSQRANQLSYIQQVFSR